MGGAIGNAMTRTLGFWVRRILPWLLRYPFVLSRPMWAVVLLLALAISAGTILIGLIPIAFAGFLVVLGVATAFIGWRRLLRKGSLPMLFIAQFRPETPGAEEASLNHQIAIRRRLAESPLIRQEVDLRDIPAAIAEKETERLLKAASTGLGVIHGTVQAVATVGSFEATLTYRTYPLGERDRVAENQRGVNTVAVHHRVATDYQVQLEELVGPHFHAHHADGIEGMLLLLLAESHLEARNYEKADAYLQAAEPFRDHMPDAGGAHLTLARTFLDYRNDLRGALRFLSKAGDDGDHPELRKAAAWLSMVGMHNGEIKPPLAVRECRRALEVSPADEALGVWLADALIEAKKPDEALAELERLKEQNYLLEHDPNIVLRTGAIQYNRGNYAEAKDAYEGLVATHPTARAHLYLADALLNLDQIRVARYHYRQALRLQPDLVDAHRGYWWKVPQDEQQKEGLVDALFLFLSRSLRRFPIKPRLKLIYRLLLLHYKRHPEDSRIHFMLGAHALLLKDLTTAEERLLFANELVGGIDTEAIARLVLVRILQDRKADAEKELQALKAVEHGHPPTGEELRERALNLYLPIFEVKDLLTFAQSQWLGEKVETIFGKNIV
jgi:tetratricopeptide (TPR) repeat protein